MVLRIAGGSYGGAETPEEWRTGTIVFLVGDGLSLIAAFLAIAVVRSSTDRLDGRAAAKAAAPPEPPADEPAEPPVLAGATA